MTEQKWMSTRRPTVMLRYLTEIGQASARKLRLYGCGCARSVWTHLRDHRSENAVLVAERFADGQATADELKDAELIARQATVGRRTWAVSAALATVYGNGVGGFCAATNKTKLALIHEVFGNPFRPVAFHPAWRTADVTAIAATIYAERRFADLPILADALEEAGCTSADLLDHCRQPGEHVRGCWAVDLVLEKT